MPLGKKNDFDYVVERLGITAKDIADTADKYKIDEDKAFQLAVLEKAMTPPLKNSYVGNPQYNSSPAYQKVGGLKIPIPTGNNMEALTGGIGGAMAGAIGGSPMGPAGAALGAMVGGAGGASTSYIMNSLRGTQGEGSSMNRILDIAAPGVGGAISKISKLGPTAKGLINTAADSLMAYLADSKDNENSATDGKSPLGRAALTAGLGGAMTSLSRQAGKQMANASLADAISEPMSPKAAGLQSGARATLQLMATDPKFAKESALLQATPELKKFVKDNPEKLYDYVLAPITGAKNQAELKNSIPLLKERFSVLPKLTGGNPEDVMQGLRSSFFNSVAKSPDGSRVTNPDSFKMRLNEMGSEVTNVIMGKDAYEKLNILSEAASKAGALGRFAIRMGDGHMWVAKMVPLDKDVKMTGKVMDTGKAFSMLSTPISGVKGAALAGGIQGYEVIKIGIDKVLNKTDKKTLMAISSGLMNSSSNSVVNKLTEWFEKNGEKIKVPGEIEAQDPRSIF